MIIVVSVLSFPRFYLTDRPASLRACYSSKFKEFNFVLQVMETAQALLHGFKIDP